MRIFLAGTSFKDSYGGPAVSVSGLAASLARQGIDVAVWAPDGSALAASSSAERVRYFAGSLEGALQDFGRPNLVHDNGIWLRHNHALATLCRHRQIARVVSPRGMLEPWALSHKRVKKEIAWRIYQKGDLQAADLLHATSIAEAESLIRLNTGALIETVPNGVPFVCSRLGELPVSKSLKYALFLGRICPVKGLQNLIPAWAKVRPDGWRLRIAGPDEGGYQKNIAELVRECGLLEIVEFVGTISGDKKRRLLEGADLFILPSLSESFGMAIGEALAVGCPVITTTATPWREIKTADCGWQVPANSSSLATALQEATSLPPETLKAMGERGRALIRNHYQWNSLVDRYITMYRRAVDRSERKLGAKPAKPRARTQRAGVVRREV